MDIIFISLYRSFWRTVSRRSRDKARRMRGAEGVGHKSYFSKCFTANALPEPDFKYFSNLKATFSSLNAK